jgi:hypothetical protein
MHGEGEEGGQPPHVSHLGNLQVREERTVDNMNPRNFLIEKYFLGCS